MVWNSVQQPTRHTVSCNLDNPYILRPMFLWLPVWSSGRHFTTTRVNSTRAPINFMSTWNLLYTILCIAVCFHLYISNILQRVARNSWSNYCEAVESSESTTRCLSSDVYYFGRLIDWNVVGYSCALQVSLSTFSRSLLSVLEPLHSQVHSSSHCCLPSAELLVSSSPPILLLLPSSSRSDATYKMLVACIRWTLHSIKVTRVSMPNQFHVFAKFIHILKIQVNWKLYTKFYLCFLA